jgi:GNAT superfamily N-acetyltransferase
MTAMTEAKSFTLRAAEPRDVASLIALITGLAEYEKLEHLLEVTPERLSEHLFGEQPVVEAIVAESADEPARALGFALFFKNYSTFLGKPGLYLEDLFVIPEARGFGVGRALIQAVARIAVQRDYGRFEWSVLDWNAPAIRFYEGVGATVMPEWRICRLVGPALLSFGR